MYHGQGPAALESYEVPLLSWDDYQAIKAGGEAAPALPAGEGAAASAKGRLLEGSSGEDGASDAGHDAKAARVDSAGAESVASAAPSSAAREARGAVLAGGGGGQAGEKDYETASEAGSIDIDELCELD